MMIKTISFFSIILFISCSSTKDIDKNHYNSFIAGQMSFSSEDGIIKYIDEGKGDKVIVLFHGVPVSSWVYRKMIPLLVEQGYRVIVPDMLGYGNSDSPEGYEIYNETNHAKRFIAMMDFLDIETWHHAMHDAGGLWTWELLKQAPTRIYKLTVLNTLVYEEGFHPPIRMKKGIKAKAAMWFYENKVTTSSMLKSLYKHALDDPDILTKADRYGYKKPLITGRTKGMYYFFTQTCEEFPDYSEVYENLEIPVQFIWGEHDEMLQFEPQRNKIIKGFNVSDSDIHILDAKHFIQEEKPKEIVRLMLTLQ